MLRGLASDGLLDTGVLFGQWNFWPSFNSGSLPAERDLALQLGVSRPSVREALIALEVEGLVEARSGSDAQVLARESPASARPVETCAFGLFEIVRARELVEGEIASLVASDASPRLLDALETALAQMDAEIGAGELPVQGDCRFYLVIPEATDHGPLLRTVAEPYDIRNSPLSEQFGQHLESADSWHAPVA